MKFFYSRIFLFCITLCNLNILKSNNDIENKKFVEEFFSYINSSVLGFRVPKNLIINGDFSSNNITSGGLLTSIDGIVSNGEVVISEGDLNISNGSLNITGNVLINENLTCKNITISDDITISGNVNINATGAGETNIGNSNSGAVYIDGGQEGLFLGKNTKNINLGDNNLTENFSIYTNSTENGIVTFTSKSLVYNISDLELPTKQGFYKYLVVDKDGYLLTKDVEVSGGEVQIDNLNVSLSTTLHGTVDINKTGSGTTTIGSDFITIGNLDAENCSLSGKNLNIGSSGALLIGFAGETGGPVQINGNDITLTGSNLILNFDSIPLPSSNDVSFNLAIDSTGKVISNQTTEEINTNIFENIEVNGNFSAKGIVNINTDGTGVSNIGNFSGGEINILSSENITINSNENDVLIKGNNLNFDFENIVLPESGSRYLVIDELGNLSSVALSLTDDDSETVSSLNVSTQITVIGDTLINTTGSGITNIGTGNYSGAINIGNTNSGSLLLNSGGNGIEIGVSSNCPINIGNSTNNTVLNLTTNNTNGKIQFFGKNLKFNLSSIDLPSGEDLCYLYIDSNGYLKALIGQVLEDDLTVGNLTVSENATFLGDLKINLESDAGTATTINGETILIGSLDNTNNLEIYSNNGIIGTNNTLLIGTDGETGGSVQITGGDVFIAGNILSLDFSSIDLPENTGFNYLAIDIDGKISSFPILNDDSISINYIGNIKINDTGEGYIYLGNLTNGGNVKIQSTEQITLETSNNANISINSTDGSIIIDSIDIALPNSGTIPLLINSEGKITTEQPSLRSLKNNIKNLETKKDSFKKLNFKKFIYKDGIEDWGLIAEDLIGTEFEKAVIFGKNNEVLGINYRMIFIAMIKDYLDSCIELDSLKKETENLENMVNQIYELYSIN